MRLESIAEADRESLGSCRFLTRECKTQGKVGEEIGVGVLRKG